MRYIYQITILLITGILISCQEDKEPVTSSLAIDIEGYVQKGPFINGTAITLSELDKKLIATGKNFTTQIADNRGSFSLKDIQLQSNFVQLQAEGFYFDEVKGEKSAAQLTLFALADVSDASSVNVNLLSHLERNRVIYLMQEEELDFPMAKSQAQREILTVFGIASDSIGYSEQLDISQGGDQNAVLLAISAILQGNNRVAELSELTANLITDLREDGTLNSESIQTKLKEQAKLLDLPQIRQNLEDRYAEMGVEATIPNFEQYIDSDGDGILNKDEDDTPEDFAFETQVDVAINDTITSNAITVTGLKEGGIAVASVGNGWLVVNDEIIEREILGKTGEDTLSTAEVKNGDKLQISLVSSSQFADTASATVTIGTASHAFRVVTDDYIPNAFSFSPLTEVAVDSLYTSDTITVSGIPYVTPVTVTKGVLIKNGEVISDDSASVKNGDQLALQLRSSLEFEVTTTASLEINGVTGDFSIITDNYSPDPFTFQSIENATRDTYYQSDTITITGLPHPTPSSIAWFSASGQWADNPEPAKLYINGAIAPGNGELSLVDGDQIYIELLSSNEYEIVSNASLTINDLSIDFNVTTELNPWQKKNNFPLQLGEELFQTSFSTDRKVYVGGVYNEYWDNSGNVIVDSRDLYEYDSETDEWTVLTAFPTNERPSPGFVHNNKAYMTFGSELWEYNIIDNNWTLKQSLPITPNSIRSAFTLDNKGYFLGYDQLWKYDVVSDTWSQKADPPYDYTGRRKFVTFALGNYIYAFYPNGNYDEEGEYFDVWQYETQSNSWTQKLDIVLEDHYMMTGFAASNSGYIISDTNMYRYDVETDSLHSINYSSGVNYNAIGISTPVKGYYMDNIGLYEFTPPQE